MSATRRIKGKRIANSRVVFVIEPKSCDGIYGAFMDKRWKRLFEQKIRSRGKDYAFNSVSDYVADERGYSATVSGAEEYAVFVSADYQTMTCTCAYAKENKYCKHMAAVLYYAENLEKQKKEQERKAEEKRKRQEAREVIAEMREKLGKNSIVECFNFTQPIDEWKQEVKDLIAEYSDKDGNIGYWEADEFVSALMNSFKNLYGFVSRCEDKTAIDASLWLYKTFHSIYVDDSSTGCTWYFEEEMLSLWRELSEYSDENKQLITKALQALKNRGQAYHDFLETKTDDTVDFKWDDTEE